LIEFRSAWDGTYESPPKFAEILVAKFKVDLGTCSRTGYVLSPNLMFKRFLSHIYNGPNWKGCKLVNAGILHPMHCMMDENIKNINTPFTIRGDIIFSLLLKRQ